MADESHKGLYYNKVVVAIVKNSCGQVLIVKRKREIDSIIEGTLSWTFPGGRILDGEKTSDVLKKHALEQSGYKIEVKSKISERTYHPFKNNLAYFECDLVVEEQSGFTRKGIERFLWVAPSDLSNYFTTSIDLGVKGFLGL
ncbi:NUDIX hydrolase [Patescibacteria group bacterium]|nr:NUDIX hydrolase [Patescibacteria group bacterium]